jgi:iron complex transport system ATP-binding protein
LIAWLPQRPAVPPGFTTEELVAQARFRFGESGAVARKHALRLLRERGAGHLIGRCVDAISGGELQRVLLATMSAQDAPLLLVDEPANHLDPAAQLETYRLLGRLWLEEGRGLCVVTHDIRLAQLLGPSNRIEVVGMRAGQVEVRTTLNDPALAQHLEALYGVPFMSAGTPGGLGVRLSEHEAS